jgi:hypothetical protein
LRCICCCNELFLDLPSRVLGQIVVSQHNVDSAKDCNIELGKVFDESVCVWGAYSWLSRILSRA